MQTRIIREVRNEEAIILYEAQRAVISEFDGLLILEPDELNVESFIEKIAYISSGNGKYLVAIVRDSIVGHAVLWPMGVRNLAHVVRLELCHIGHWHQGHGRALLEELINWARAKPDVKKIELLVRCENKAAIALYTSVGFVEEGRLKNRVRLRSGRFIDDITMALFVDNSKN